PVRGRAPPRRDRGPPARLRGDHHGAEPRRGPDARRARRRPEGDHHAQHAAERHRLRDGLLARARWGPAAAARAATLIDPGAGRWGPRGARLRGLRSGEPLAWLACTPAPPVSTPGPPPPRARGGAVPPRA